MWAAEYRVKIIQLGFLLKKKEKTVRVGGHATYLITASIPEVIKAECHANPQECDHLRVRQASSADRVPSVSGWFTENGCGSARGCSSEQTGPRCRARLASCCCWAQILLASRVWDRAPNPNNDVAVGNEKHYPAGLYQRNISKHQHKKADWCSKQMESKTRHLCLGGQAHLQPFVFPFFSGFG